MSPLLHPSQFPDSLWLPNFVSAGHPNHKGILKIPAELQHCYLQTLHELQLLNTATSESDDDSNIIGGGTDEEAEQHFAKRFNASMGRLQLYALDPNRKFLTTLDALISAFSAGCVRVLDIPIGAGASILTLISIIAELREKGKLETRPVEIHITGGDISARSLAISQRLLARIRPWWARNNITTYPTMLSWDVLDPDSTTDLADQWLGNGDARDRYVLVGGNFSGFLGSTVNEKKPERWMTRAASQLNQIVSRGAKQNLAVFWVEPQMKPAKNHLLPFLNQEVLGKSKRLTPCYSGFREDAGMVASCILKDDAFVARATGLHFRRSGQA
jgi:hypothetical protein